MDTVLDHVDQTFVHAAEVWVPEGDTLVIAQGDYRAAEGFGSASARRSFAHGEGLPGKAWAEACPIVLSKFEGSYFQRQEAAAEAGLTSAVAIPVFADRVLTSVLVILCGTADARNGAIEIWAEADGVLALRDGYYGDAGAFAEVSRGITFARGVGLPGTVWSSRSPVLMRDIGANHSFVRAAKAGEIGLKTGLGIPVCVPGGTDYVMTLLSAPGTPIARRFEIWDARPNRAGAAKRAVLVDGICERDGPLWAEQNPPVDPPSVGPWQGPIGQALGSGRPCVMGGGAGLPAGYGSITALPVYRGADLSHIVAWYV